MPCLQFHIIWTIIELERGQFCSVRKCAEVRNIPVLRNIPVKYVISILSNSYAVVEAAYQIEHLAQQPAIFLPKGPMNFNKPLLAYVRRGKILKVTSTLRPSVLNRPAGPAEGYAGAGLGIEI